jgi:hypothetical protein
MGYLANISQHVWLERFLAVSQSFLSRLLAVSRRSSAKNAWLHIVSMGNGNLSYFCMFWGL